MVVSPQHTALQIDFVAAEVLARLKGTQEGHCTRVNFLERAEAISICQQLVQQVEQGIAVHILTADASEAQQNPVFIGTDRAIEIRNRKKERLCLFVPSDIADAAYSSIANSFAQIDGRDLHAAVLRRVQSQLAPLSAEANTMVRAAFGKLRGLPGISDERRLDFAVAALERAQAGEVGLTGLELWRVGLIADAGEDFLSRLESNRNSTLALARPGKLDATALERIQSLKVDTATATALGRFFRGRAMNDVHEWSHDLIEAQLTFDSWVFPHSDPSDIRAVKVKPFTNAKGVVERFCHLIQPGGSGGGLYARYSAKETLVVKWDCEPAHPKNLHSWHIGIVPEGSEPGFEHALEERYVPENRRSVTIKLDLDLDEPPDHAVCVRVVPLNPDGSEIRNKDTDKVYFADSQEFYLVRDLADPAPVSPRESRRTVPTLAFGRLEAAAEMRETVLEETEPQWQSKDLEYFSLRINDQRALHIGLSSTLRQLEKQVLDEPRKGGCFVLNSDEIRPVSMAEIIPYGLAAGGSESWTAFWRQRELFFKRLNQAEGRDLVEVADWTPDLAGAALRYAQAYRELLDNLIRSQAESGEIADALSIDTLLVTIASSNQKTEEALVILPTHPLRAAWFASYTQLLRTWETALVEVPQRKRKQNVDLHALRLLVPTNVPPFAYHAATTKAFPFFQNLLFFHGIALPAEVPDPHRRYGDVAIILNADSELAGIGDMQPERLKEHLQMFQDLHPYADTLVTTLINPDRGNFFAEAVRKLLPASKAEEAEVTPMPLFQITAYTEDWQTGTLQAIERMLQQPAGQQYRRLTDHFLPGLVTTARHMRELENEKPPEAHIAIVTDFARPTIIAAPAMAAKQVSDDLSSFSFYGLIARFLSQFRVNEDGMVWRHQIVTEGVRKPEPHPAGPRYSETLIDVQTSLLNAGGYLLNGSNETYPMLEVRLDQRRRDLLELLHEETNWVITLDRFFTLDYYDSPNAPGLDNVARKYVLDYAPEFTEGLGHRMMVTTAWHEEISSLLSQAMDELGFASVDQSVSHLLHYLKTISGRLALQALESPTNAAAAVGLGVVTAWLQRQGRLKQAVLVPVDVYPRLFSLEGAGRPAEGEKRCDLVLIALRRNIVDATFIEVKWRRGRNTPLETLAPEMVLQMKVAEHAMRKRFFNEEQIDGALQRSYLANVLRFYFERSRRYQLFDPAAEQTFLEHIARLEKTRLDFKASYEGYIVSLESEPRKPLVIDDARITVLTAREFADTPQFFAPVPLDQMDGASTWTPGGMQPLGEEREAGREDELADRGIQEDDGPQFAPPVEDQQGGAPANGEVVVPLGSALDGAVEWYPSVKGSPHLFILGIPGQGKSWTITHLLSELGNQQVPALVLDFHGQFADPQGPYCQSIEPTVLAAAKGLPFSPFECTTGDGSGDWRANAMAVAEIFANVANLGDMQRDIVYTAIRDAYRAHGFDDDATEEEIRERVYPTIEEVFRDIERKEQARHTGNVTARCRPLLEMNLFRPPERPRNLFSFARNGLVIDLQGLNVELLQQAAGAFVLRKLYKDMFHWGYADRLRLAVVLDEAHRLAKDVTLPKIMKEGRKFGIAVIVASQGLNDFHPDIINNVGTKVIFRMNYPESKKAAGFIRVGQGQNAAARIEQLSIGTAYVQTPEMSRGAVVHMGSDTRAREE